MQLSSGSLVDRAHSWQQSLEDREEGAVHELEASPPALLGAPGSQPWSNKPRGHNAETAFPPSTDLTALCSSHPTPVEAPICDGIFHLKSKQRSGEAEVSLAGVGSCSASNTDWRYDLQQATSSSGPQMPICMCHKGSP